MCLIHEQNPLITTRVFQGTHVSPAGADKHINCDRQTDGQGDDKEVMLQCIGLFRK